MWALVVRRPRWTSTRRPPRTRISASSAASLSGGRLFADLADEFWMVAEPCGEVPRPCGIRIRQIQSVDFGMAAEHASRLDVHAADPVVLFAADDGLGEAFGLDGAHVAQDACRAFQGPLVGPVFDASVVGAPHDVLDAQGESGADSRDVVGAVHAATSILSRRLSSSRGPAWSV